MKHIRLFAAVLVLLLGLGGMVPASAAPAVPPAPATPSAPATPAADTPQSTVCQTIKAGDDCKTDPPNSISLNKAISALVNILSFLIGVAAVVMIILGGFRYVISNGDSAKMNSARDTILYAIVGLVVTAIAQIIVRFVLQNVKS